MKVLCMIERQNENAQDELSRRDKVIGMALDRIDLNGSYLSDDAFVSHNLDKRLQ